jgi:hypothetical protein
VLLGVCLLLGLAIAAVLGVDVWRTLDLRLRQTWTVWAALAIQIFIFTPLSGRLPSSSVAPLHVSSYALIGIFLAMNLRVAGMPLIAAGWLANTVAITANHGRMPISLRDWKLVGRAGGAITTTGVDNNNVLAAHGHLVWLGDIFPLPARLPLANAFSIGDILIVAGAVAVVSLAGTKPARLTAVLAPLREPRFVRLVGVRGVSQLGDWITTAAAVTWLYERTDATWPVSCYLGARITASLLGGLIGHRFVGESGRERFGLLFGLRGALTAGALLAALSGATVVLPISLLVLSAVVAPITNAGTAALTPTTVADDILHQANALSGFVLELAVVAGAALGGVLELPFGLSLPLGVDAATFALAALAFARPALRPGVLPGGAEEPTRPATFTQLSARLMRHRAARPLLLSFAVATAAVGMLNASLPRFMTHLDASGGYGTALACIGGGAMLAGLLAGSINESRAIDRSVFLGFLGMAGAVALLAYSTVPATAFLILVLIGMLDATTEVSYSTIIQRAFPARHLTAIMTVASAFISGGMVIGFAAAAAGERVAPQASLLLPAAGCGLAALLAVPLARQRRTAAAPESLPSTLARGLLQLPALLETTTGRTVAVVAEEHGRWLAYPADAVQDDADLRLRLAGFELAARPVASAGHHGAWIEVTDVNRVRRAA